MRKDAVRGVVTASHALYKIPGANIGVLSRVKAGPQRSARPPVPCNAIVNISGLITDLMFAL